MIRASRRTGSIDVAQRYVDHLNRILNTTISESRLVAVGSTATSEFVIRREHGPIQLRPGQQRWLSLQQAIMIRQPQGKVIVRDAAYTYSRSRNPDDEAAKVFMYHYHREGHDRQPQSHYHICAQQDGRDIKRVHFPTGRLSIEQLLAHLLLEQGVQPLTDLDEAMGVLRTSHSRFMNELRTDSSLFP